MTTLLHARPYDGFIEIQSNLRRKKINRINQLSNFLGGGFSNRQNVRAPIQFRREIQPQHLFSRTDLSIFTSIALVFLDQSNKTSSVFPSLKSTSHFLLQSTMSCRSDSSSEVNSGCYQRSDT